MKVGLCGARRSLRCCSAPITLLSLLLAAGCLRTRHPSQFLIPKGYVGWVDVSYGVNGAPPLPVEGGCYVIKVSPRGTAQTSTEIEAGRVGDQFYYSDGTQRQQLHSSNA